MFTCEKCGEEVYTICYIDGLDVCQDCWNKIVDRQEETVAKSRFEPADDFEFFQMLNIFNK